MKRAYRRLARRHHPDVGGDEARFHALQRAYERLVARGDRDVVVTGRPARGPGGTWGAPPGRRWSEEPVDLDRIDWDRELDAAHAKRLDATTIALSVSRPSPGAPGPVAPMRARSRGPGSLLNRFVGLLDPELTATLDVGTYRGRADGRGVPGHDVELRLRCGSRAGRRRIDAVLPDGWVRVRGSTTTTLTRVMHPSIDRRATAARVATALEKALDALDWPVGSWYLLGDDHA